MLAAVAINTFANVVVVEKKPSPSNSSIIGRFIADVVRLGDLGAPLPDVHFEARVSDRLHGCLGV